MALKSILGINDMVINKYGNTILNKADNGVEYLTFELLNKAGVKHAFSTRAGGVSEGIYRSMNLSFHRGDSFENVMRNHELFSEAVGYNHKDTVFSDQVHETKIVRVTHTDKGRGMKGEKGIPATDGLVTDQPGIPLMTFYADCVPLLFYDPVKKVIAAAHSGWRGTVAGMGRIMVKFLEEEMSCSKEDILAVIGPSICMDCYEVSEDVAEEFYTAFPERIHTDILFDKGNGKFRLNLWEANRYILSDAGLTADHVQVPDICTCHNPEMMISHRQTGGKRGNMAAVITL